MKDTLICFMGTECDVRKNIILDTSPDGLNNLTDLSLQLIQKHVFRNAKRVNPSTAVTVDISYPSISHTISPSELVFEMEKMELDRKLAIDTKGIKGCYNSGEGKIYLNKELWCIETIIHETLHACSRTSESNQLDKYLPLYEGLTEFYTGYILFKEFEECYRNCFQTNFGRLCQMTYEDTTKLWVACCNFISLSDTIELYFNSEKNWEESVKDFVEKVKSKYSNFSNPFSKGGMSVQLKFEIQCSKAFGDGFREICKDRNRFVDFSNVLKN